MKKTYKKAISRKSPRDARAINKLMKLNKLALAELVHEYTGVINELKSING